MASSPWSCSPILGRWHGKSSDFLARSLLLFVSRMTINLHQTLGNVRRGLVEMIQAQESGEPLGIYALYYLVLPGRSNGLFLVLEWRHRVHEKKWRRDFPTCGKCWMYNCWLWSCPESLLVQDSGKNLTRIAGPSHYSSSQLELPHPMASFSLFLLLKVIYLRHYRLLKLRAFPVRMYLPLFSVLNHCSVIAMLSFHPSWPLKCWMVACKVALAQNAANIVFSICPLFW